MYGITSKSQEKDLGLTISTDMKPSVHIAKVVKQAEMCLAVIKRTIVNRDVAVFFILYRQLVRLSWSMLFQYGIFISCVTLN